MNAKRAPQGGDVATEPASPCVDVCVMDDAGRYCQGCWRTLDEIAGWAGYSAAEKRAVLTRLPARRQSVAPP